VVRLILVAWTITFGPTTRLFLTRSVGEQELADRFRSEFPRREEFFKSNMQIETTLRVIH